jgi:predicted dehydrogenase
VTERLRVGLVGAGYMGRLHAEKLAERAQRSQDVTLAGVADLVVDRAEALASTLNCTATSDFRTLLPECDAMVVAVPTVSHSSVVSELLAAGIDVLVEKPIAASLEEAESLLDLAKRGERILQVGHLEWFNAAMQVIRERVRKPRFIEVHRLGPFPDRATDVDVVRDLMIHDLDILQQVLGEEPERIEAVGVPVLTENVDIANARLVFPSGCVANLTASRVSATPMRKIRFFQPDGYISIDFLEQSAAIFRREDSTSGGSEVKMEQIEVDRGDALRDQLDAFVRAVRFREEPHVNGSSGLTALRTALRVMDAIPPFDGVR